MATFNEQKGQGTFQPVLSDSGATGDPGRTVPGPALGGAAAATSGVADILSILANQPLDPKSDSPELAANKADLESRLTGELSLIAGQPITGGVLQGSKEEIAKVAAGYEQGRISRNEMNVRLASIVQRYVAGDPRNAEQYREIARTALGYQPSAQIAADELADLEFEQTQQRQIVRDDADYARQQYGYVAFDAFGNVDVETMADKGRELRAQDAKTRKLKELADLLKTQEETRQARKLTEEEKKRIEYSTLLDTTRPYIETHIGAAYNSIGALNSGNFGDMSEDEYREIVTNEINGREAAVRALINDTALRGNISSTAREAALATATATFDSARALLSGDRSTFATNKVILDKIQVSNDRQLAETAPFLDAANRVLGDQTTAAIVNVAVDSDPELRNNIRVKIRDEVTKTLGNVTTVMGDQNAEIADLASDDRPATAKALLTTIDTLSRRPQRNTDQEKANLVTANAKLIRAASNVSSVEDRSKAAQRLSTEANLSALTAYAANDATAAETAASLRDLNAQAFSESARRLTPDTTIQQLGTAVATRGLIKPLTFVPAYDPESGRIVILSGRGEEFSLADERVPPFMKNEIEKMNKNLDTVVRLKGIGPSDIKNVPDADLRRVFVDASGIRVIGEE